MIGGLRRLNGHKLNSHELGGSHSPLATFEIIFAHRNHIAKLSFSLEVAAFKSFFSVWLTGRAPIQTSTFQA